MKESPPPQPATTSIFPLPSEINDMIFSYLPIESVIALALTCRFLFESMPPSCLRVLNKEERFKLLGFLEKDTPHLYACHRCLHLHIWPGMARQPGIGEYGKARSCRIKNSRRFVLLTPPDYSYGMSYALARLITNRHLYGEQHGLPLEVLNRTVVEQDRFMNMGIRLENSWTARIIDDELYLKATVQVYHKKGDEGVFRKRFGKVLPSYKSLLRFSANGRRKPNERWRLAWQDQQRELLTRDRTLVCQHIGGPGSAKWWGYNWGGRDLNRLKDSGGLLRPRTGEIRSCRYCFTDFRVDFQWRPLDSEGPKGWVVRYTRWHRLGDCRSPLDPRWYNYIQERFWDIPEPRINSCAAGMVYHNWRARDGAAGSGAADDEDQVNELTNAAFSNRCWPIDH